MFGKKSESDATPTTSQEDASGGKGRPTPSRKEAEAARKTRAKVPNNPKEAKKAARDRARQDRERSRQGMMAGDQRYLQPRDQGPGKAFTRDFVDSRFALAEYFIVVAVFVLVLNSANVPSFSYDKIVHHN